jgi:pimeloyl-ACP methyl ester carboxylesterase
VRPYSRLPGVRHFLDTFGRGRKLIRIDFSGNGMSERNFEDHSPEAATDDPEAVLDDVDIERVDIIAGGIRASPALGMAIRGPTSVNRIVLAFPFLVRPVAGQPGRSRVRILTSTNRPRQQANLV